MIVFTRCLYPLFKMQIITLISLFKYAVSFHRMTNDLPSSIKLQLTSSESDLSIVQIIIQLQCSNTATY